MMESNQVEAWKRIKNAGTVSLVRGWISIVVLAVWLIVGILFIAMPFDIPGEPGEAPLPSAFLGVIFVIISILSLPFSVLDIIAGIKLRKPVPQPMNWLLYTFASGVLVATSIPGIIQIVFSVLALNMSHFTKNGAKTEHHSGDENKSSS